MKLAVEEKMEIVWEISSGGPAVQLYYSYQLISSRGLLNVTPELSCCLFSDMGFIILLWQVFA